MKPRKKKRRNPAGLLSNKELFEVAANQCITRNFGMVGLALSYGTPKFREFLLKCSGVVVDSPVLDLDFEEKNGAD